MIRAPNILQFHNFVDLFVIHSRNNRLFKLLNVCKKLIGSIKGFNLLKTKNLINNKILLTRNHLPPCSATLLGTDT